MLGMMLVMAGLTAGDGGVRAGAATAPLAEPPRLDFSREWQGALDVGGVFGVSLERGRMTTFSPRGHWDTHPFALKLLHGSLAVGSCGEERFHGTYKVEGGRLLVCFVPLGEPRPTACTPHNGILLTLRPPARRP